MADYDGYSSGEERHKAEIRRAIALSTRDMQPDGSQPDESSLGNRSSGTRNSRTNPRPLPRRVAAALLASNLATPSAIAASVSRDSPVRISAEVAAASRAHPPSNSSTSRGGLADDSMQIEADTQAESGRALLSAFAMLDRKKMEEERLARVRLRAQGASVPGNSSTCDRPPTGDEQQRTNKKRKLTDEPNVVERDVIDLGSSDDESKSKPIVYRPREERKVTETSEKQRKVIVIDSDSEPDIKPPKELESKLKGKQAFKLDTISPKKPGSSTQASEPDIKSPKRPEQKHTVKQAASPVTPAPTAILSARSVSRPTLRFPDGAVKKTWLAGRSDNTNAITIQEVLQKDQLRFAVISSFQWDGRFLLENINASRTHIILVAHAEDEAHKAELVSNVPNTNFRYVFPKKHGYGTMHSKLMLLKYDNYMRIAVPTANFVKYDWGLTGAMENTVFLIDLLIREHRVDIWSQGPFASSLARFLELSGFEENIISSLGKYDFTKANKHRFVFSASGPQSPRDRDLSGLCGLATAVRSLGLATNNPIEVDIVSSSIGILPTEFLNKIYLCLRGFQISEEETNQDGTKRYINAKMEDHMRVHFPSLETVNESKFGQDGAGSLCLSRKTWFTHGFVQKVFRDCVSTRGNILMHNKLYYVREKTEQGTKAWAYVGSANLSRNAWGRFSKTRAGVSNIVGANWECGVVFVVNDGQCVSQDDNDVVAPLSIFDSISPVPFDPAKAREYVTTSGLDPWFME